MFYPNNKYFKIKYH